MASAVNDLKALIPPTSAPPPELDWTDIEGRLGLRLPLDYKRLVEAYGQGAFDGFLWVLQPSETNQNLDLLRQRGTRLAALRTLRASGEQVPFGLENSHEELMPWAFTDNGDVCYWVISASDDSDEWVVTVNEARGARWKTFDLSASEFLVAVLSGDLHVDLFPDDFPSDSPAFQAVATEASAAWQRPPLAGARGRAGGDLAGSCADLPLSRGGASCCLPCPSSS